MRIIDIENSVNFYFDENNRKKLQEIARKEEANWETEYSKDYKEGVSGTKRTKYKGKLHSRNDEPSYIHYFTDGEKYLVWHKEGKFHKLTGPALIGIGGDGKEAYYLEGKEYWYKDWLIERKRHKDWDDSMHLAP